MLNNKYESEMEELRISILRFITKSLIYQPGLFELFTDFINGKFFFIILNP